MADRLRVVGTEFTCGGCSGTLYVDRDLAYIGGLGYRCRCGWVLKAKPFLGSWYTIRPRP